MKSFKRMSFGIISSLLLTVGLARAAQQVDPLSQTLGTETKENATMTPASNCAQPCLFF